MKDRLMTAAAVVVLLAVGFLVGSFWLEWRGQRLDDGDGGPSPAASLPPEGEPRTRVEVLNGMGEPGAAERAAARLRGMGFDVVYFGNADRFDHARTRVLARSRDTAAVRALADSLGVEGYTVRAAPDLYLDGTVILGGDWDSLVARRRTSRAEDDATSSLDRLLDGLLR